MSPAHTVRLAIAPVLAILAFSACSASPSPKITRNPRPVERHELTLRIEGAPGPFDSMDGYVMFQVLNDRCLPLQPLSGARLALEKRVPLELVPIGGGTYQATFFTDQLIDENYYGLGVCHWTATYAGALLHRKSATFSAGLRLRGKMLALSTVNYFANTLYRHPKEGAIDTGGPQTDFMRAHPAGFFSVEASVMESAAR